MRFAQALRIVQARNSISEPKRLKEPTVEELKVIEEGRLRAKERAAKAMKIIQKQIPVAY